MSKSFFQEFGGVFVASMGGIAGVVLGYVATVKTMGTDALLWWIASFACLIFSAYVMWRKEHGKVKELTAQLESRGLTAARKEQARKWLLSLSDAEREAMRQLLLDVRAFGDQIRNWHPGVDFVQIHKTMPFLVLDEDRDRWSIDPEWQAILTELLTGNGALT